MKTPKLIATVLTVAAIGALPASAAAACPSPPAKGGYVNHNEILTTSPGRLVGNHNEVLASS